MKLSTRTTYGLRVCFLLAVAEGTVSLARLSEQSGQSFKYLEQLMIRLKKAGIVESVRGVNGGYNLARPADKITVCDILDAMDDNFEFDCNTVCTDDYCPNRRIFQRLACSIHDVLGKTTLRDMIADFKCK